MNTFQDKTIQKLCKLGFNDPLVMVNMHQEIKGFLILSAESKGLTLSEECYLRLCESVENSVSVPETTNHSWYDFIFNKELAVNPQEFKGTAR
jgi:hypothetical protein